MPEQAILDLPLVEFEQFQGRLEEIVSHCSSIYGITGLKPHQDAAFHLTASLYRYRDGESLYQLSAIATFFLRALSASFGAERRVQALSAAGFPREELGEAKGELTLARETANDLCRLMLAVAGRHAVQSRRNRVAASARLSKNLNLIAQPQFQAELEGLLGPLLSADFSQLPFNLDPPEVFARLDREKALLTKPQNGHSQKSGRLSAIADDAVNEAASNLRGLGGLKSELESVRADLRAAGAELKKLSQERSELEEMLKQSEARANERELALEEARSALELAVSEARERLGRVEREQKTELEQTRKKLADLSIERERFAAEVARLTRELENTQRARKEADGEMTRVLHRATISESQREDLIATVEAFDAERDVAAKTIEALKEKVAASKDMLARRDETIAEMQQTLDSLRDELVNSETKLATAQASIEALETEADNLRNEAANYAKTGSNLTVSESKLNQAQAKLASAQLRISQLEAAVSDGKERLAQSENRFKEQRRSMDAVSGQLAEAETLSNERAEKISRLEIELSEARRGLGESQAKLSESSARLKTVASTGKDAEQEVARVRALLEEQRRACAKLEEALKARDAELARARQKESEQSQRAAKFEEELNKLRREIEKQSRELGTKAGETEKEASETRQKLVAAELRLMDTQQQLAAAEEDSRAASERAADLRQKLEAELGLLRERLSHAEAEREQLVKSLTRGEESQRGERGALEKRLQKLEEEAREREREFDKARAEAEKVRKKLDETDAFLIARQRELDRVQTRQKYFVSEIKTIADLRTRMEQSSSAENSNALASEVARRLDNLFSEAGAPVHADRRTEKIVVLHLKKSEGEIAAENKPFVATGDQAKEQAEEEKKEDTRSVEAKAVKPKRTSKKAKA